ncbi:MAG: ECF transporter S component [Clostridia bacterium]|nr:ECF transporter S component [Clostridia bacterium]
MKTKLYKNSDIIRKITFGAVSLALFMVLPFVTGAIPEIGGMLCPMHIPALLSGALLGPWIGGLLSFIAPIIRSLIFGAPLLYPRAVSMAFELAAYAICFGLLLKVLPKKIYCVYASLGIAMLAGRIVGGITKIFFLAFGTINSYGWKLFFVGYFVETLPGVVLQLILIPPVLFALERAKLYDYSKKT